MDANKCGLKEISKTKLEMSWKLLPCCGFHSAWSAMQIAGGEKASGTLPNHSQIEGHIGPYLNHWL